MIIIRSPRGGIGPLDIWFMTAACWAITGIGIYLTNHGQPGAINMALGAGTIALLLTGVAMWASITEVIDRRRNERNQ